MSTFDPRNRTDQRRVMSHFLVFANNIKISPLLLNDDGSAFEIYSITSRNELVDCFQSQRPGCLVTTMDDGFLDHPNINLMSRLMPIVVVTNTSSVTTAAEAAKRGAHSVVRNLQDPEKFRIAVRNACFADNSHELGPFAMRCRINKLTSKENQVLYMSLRGKTTKMISGELGVCHQTVDKHKKRALSKLKATSIVDLMNMLMDSHRIACGLNAKIASLPRPNMQVNRPSQPASQSESSGYLNG